MACDFLSNSSCLRDKDRKEVHLALCSRAFFFFFFFFGKFNTVRLALWSTRLEKRELVSVLLVHLCLFYTRWVLSFSLPLGVRGWLRIVIVARPGLFYKLFSTLSFWSFQLILVTYIKILFVENKMEYKPGRGHFSMNSVPAGQNVYLGFKN